MKILWIFLLLIFSVEVMCQDAEKLKLPNPANVGRIEISKTGMKNWYNAEELLKLLPKFVASEGTYLSKVIPFQYGKFILKNGKEMNWMANSADSILLIEGSTEQLFVLPKAEKPAFLIWDKDGKESYIDINGNPAQKPKEKVTLNFSEGLAPVKVGDKWGYMNEKGEIVIKPRWKGLGLNSPLGNFSEGLAVVYDEINSAPVQDENYTYDTYKCGYINTKGEYVIQPTKFRYSCGNFYNGLARTEADFLGDELQKGKGHIGFIDKKGNWAIPPQFFQATGFEKGFAMVQSEPMSKDLQRIHPQSGYNQENPRRKSLYLIDNKGNKVEGIPDCGWRYKFFDGLAYDYDDNPQPFHFLNEKCEVVFRIPNDIELIAYTFYTGLLAVRKEINGKKMSDFLDTKGKPLFGFKFTQIDYFSEGLAGVEYQENGKDYKGYIDQTGNLVLKNTGRNAPFKNGLALQHLYTWTISERPNARNIYGYMNRQGKYVWLSPNAENYLDKDWIRENYVGPK